MTRARAAVSEVERERGGEPRVAVGKMGGSSSLVAPAKALPGRAQKMAISAKHYVLGNQMEGPFPSGLQIAYMANGCFWGSEKGMWRLPGQGIYSTAVGCACTGV